MENNSSEWNPVPPTPPMANFPLNIFGNWSSDNDSSFVSSPSLDDRIHSTFPKPLPIVEDLSPEFSSSPSPITTTESAVTSESISTSGMIVEEPVNLTLLCTDYCLQAVQHCASLSNISFNSTMSTAPEELDQPGSETVEADMSTLKIIFILLPLIIISLIIILGNLLVIIAVFTQRSLRSPQNIYIVSLAIADLAVAIIVLPFNITTIMFNGIWVFGRFACKMYIILDISLCTSSILHLCAIAVDRYRSITDGINYMQRRNIGSVISVLVALWIISFWIGTEPVLDPNVPETTSDCVTPDDFSHQFHLAMGALFFPLCIMAFLYFKIYEAIKERLQERARVNCVEVTSDYDTSERIDQNSTISNSNKSANSTLSRKDKKGSLAGGGTSSKRKLSAQVSTYLVNKQKFSLTRERKAARTLGLIMGAFIICWLPLGLSNIISCLLPLAYRPSPALFQFLTWLGYINSGLNPIIYAATNKEFQKGFKRVLKINT